jgi:hypothetical protein
MTTASLVVGFRCRAPGPDRPGQNRGMEWDEGLGAKDVDLDLLVGWVSGRRRPCRPLVVFGGFRAGSGAEVAKVDLFGSFVWSSGFEEDAVEAIISGTRLQETVRRLHTQTHGVWCTIEIRPHLRLRYDFPWLRTRTRFRRNVSFGSG